MTTIRPLTTPEDLHAINRINAAAWRTAYEHILPDEYLAEFGTDFDADDARDRYQEIRAEDCLYLLAVDDTDTVLGYTYLRWGDTTKTFVDPGEAELKEIYVHPDHWGAGIGSTLLETGLDHLPAGVSVVKLEMFADNHIGDQFYDDHDFKQVDTESVTIAGDTYPTAIYQIKV